ncbi:hypothetical protein [Pseudoxanthomonas beigongshangi]|uniref:hypothetical protein n=1 Tax=Pseudoxanthomonas beigongshangi TaxID=2782537 RepID=UPI00193BAADD|nr:hypothetical protein [Pseudoxanthomonas beigongshangi]
MARRSVAQWTAGSVFLLPLMDETACIGQVIDREPDALNSVAVALFDIKGNWSKENKVPALAGDAVFSVILATKDYLDSGRWLVLGERVSAVPNEMKFYDRLRSTGFVGAKIRGSGLVEDFANAFYGLAPWDDWYVPDYLDGFLISPDKKPVERLIFCGRHK